MGKAISRASKGRGEIYGIYFPEAWSKVKSTRFDRFHDKHEIWGSSQKFQEVAKPILEMKEYMSLFWPLPHTVVGLLGWYDTYRLKSCPSIKPVRKHRALSRVEVCWCHLF